MRVLIAGANGLVGKALKRHCQSLGDEVLAYPRQMLDITDSSFVTNTIVQQAPDVVINAAAWTDVDGCESDPELADLVNAQGPANLATACREANAKFVTISTDYVFAGDKSGFYTQDDEPHPLSIYGVSKLEGERRALKANAQTIVARTGFVFGNGGRNFLSTVIARAQRKEKLLAITDAKGTPTYADDLAARLRELALLKTSGIFHVVNSGLGASYEDFVAFALEAAGLNGAKMEPVTEASLNRPAPRPANSCLLCLRSRSAGLADLPHWQEALRVFVARELEHSRLAGGVAPARP